MLMGELTVKVTQLEKILKSSQEVGAEEVSFSFVIGSLFPEAYEKIKEMLLNERIAGYNEAKQELLKRIEGYEAEDSRIN